MKKLLSALVIFAAAVLAQAQTPVVGVSANSWTFQLPQTASSTVGANAVRIWDFSIPYSVSVTKITYQIATADNTANLYDLGIYTYTGTLLCHLGPTAGTTFAPATGLQVGTFTGGPCYLQGGSLGQGHYLLAWTGNGGAAAISTSAGVILTKSFALVSGGTSGGALNSTITVPADNTSNIFGFPALRLSN